MRIRTAAVLVASITVLVGAAPAVAGTGSLTADPSHLSLSTPVGTTTEATVTFTNSSDRGIELTGSFLTYKPFLTPGNQTQLNALEFSTYDGGVGLMLGPGDSCSATVVFRPGVVDNPAPEPGTVFHARLVEETSTGQTTVRITATAT